MSGEDKARKAIEKAERRYRKAGMDPREAEERARELARRHKKKKGVG